MVLTIPRLSTYNKKEKKMTKYFDEEWPKEEEILKIGLEQSRKNKADIPKECVSKKR